MTTAGAPPLALDLGTRTLMLHHTPTATKVSELWFAQAMYDIYLRPDHYRREMQAQKDPEAAEVFERLLTIIRGYYDSDLTEEQRLAAMHQANEQTEAYLAGVGRAKLEIFSQVVVNNYDGGLSVEERIGFARLVRQARKPGSRV